MAYLGDAKLQAVREAKRPHHKHAHGGAAAEPLLERQGGQVVVDGDAMDFGGLRLPR